MATDTDALPPFLQTQLGGALLRAQRWLAGARAALAALVGGAYFFPWHVVHRTTFSFAHLADAEPVRDTGEVSVCTGYAHYQGSLAAPLLAVALVAVALLGLLRPRLWMALLLELLGIGLCVGMVRALFEVLAHLGDRVEVTWGQVLFDACFLLLAFLYVAGPLVQSALAARSRRASVA
jgi:hypothetical protein